MRKILINYADRRLYRAQHKNAHTGLTVGGFDACRRFSRGDLDDDFARRSAHILACERGAGYWLWKPYLLLRALEEAELGDFIAYADAGSYFTGSIEPLAHHCRDRSPGVAGFGVGLVERQFTKRDAFVILDCDTPTYTDTPQLMASFIAAVANEFSRRLVGSWLQFASDPRLLTDLPNTCGLPDYPDYRAHRHDQSIFSLLYKRHGLPDTTAESGIDLSTFLTITRKDPSWIWSLRHHRIVENRLRAADSRNRGNR